MGGEDGTCEECGKRVYEMEKLVADLILYHKSCFRCSQCKRLLNLSNYASMGGVLYCKPHFTELFKPKGQCEATESETGDENMENQEMEILATLPAVRNMKSLFEVHDQVPLSFSPKTVGGDTASQKQSFKWEKSEDRPPTPVNRVIEGAPGEEEEILPPADITRNLVAKFRTIQQDAVQNVGVERKPPRQFTPPRESPERQSIGFATEYPEATKTTGISAPVNHDFEGNPVEEEDILPPPDITKNLVARFHSIQHETAQNVVDRKPVRQFTPPRESPERSSSAYRSKLDEDTAGRNEVVRADDRVETEEELPPPSITRNLVAKFKTLETDGGLMSRSVEQNYSAASGSGSASRRSIVVTECVDSGVFENVPEEQNYAARETDTTDEQELPETGMTRSLVAQWKTMELNKDSDVKSMSGSRSPLGGGGGGSSKPQGLRVQQLDASSAPSHNNGTNGNDQNEEAEEFQLPPPDITRNLLAKFKTIEAETQYTANQAPLKKQYKWEVKEAKPINYPGQFTITKNPDDIVNTTIDSDDERRELDDREDGDDQPQPAYTKRMLDKFRSLEKS